MKGKKRLNFGFIFSNLDNTCQYEIWNGVVEFAKSNDINLTAYIGTYHAADFEFTAHYDSCFEIIKDNDSLDGVIMYSGLIAGAIGNEEFEALAARIPKHIPQVSVSYALPDIPSIFIDNEAGMYSAVEHLIQVHGKKNIAFIKGPEGHPEAEDRLEGYKRALAANGITFDKRYVFPGNFTPESGSLATKRILGTSDIKYDAIVASDDLTATGVLNELKRRNIRVPDDLAVIGFDDDRDSATFIPSISTVRQNFFNIGKASAKTLLNAINGKALKEIMYITPAFIARQSCGCQDDELSTLVNSSPLELEIRFKEAKNREFSILDNMVILRKVVNNLVVVFDVDTLADELSRSLPELSINTAIIGLYKNIIKSGESNADRTIDTLIGFDGKKNLKIKGGNGNPILFSDYSTIKGFEFDRERRDLLFLTLFFGDEEYGVMLISFDPGISVNTYEMLRSNISTTIKGAYLVKEMEHQNTLLIEASKAKSEFLSNMSHEMRTPMNAIIGMTAIGKRATDVEEKNYTLNRIEDASSHLLNVINDVLDMAKIEANKFSLSPVEFHFDRMLQKVITVINYRASEKEQKLFVNVDSNIPQFVIGDDKRLTQVLTNLLSNAVKFTPEGGDIRLDVSVADEIDGGCELHIEITDTGIGISPVQLSRLFQAFEQAESSTTREYGGTGLGLVISKNIIELMGGRIWVESELGKGAKFIFTLKVLYGEEKPDSLLVSDVNWKSVRILVADSSSGTHEQFQNLFKELKVKCDVAFDGYDAFRMIDEYGGYDIYFIDWFIPGMGIIDLSRHIKSISDVNSSVVTMISTMNWDQIKTEATDAGVDKHLVKPLFSSMIIDCINECFDVGYINNESIRLEQGVFSGKNLLLAEDIPINREIFIALMSDTGLNIDCAENGKEALDMVEAAPEKYDIVLMDVQMPRMSGYEATRCIRALPALKDIKLPIIAMTANVFKSDIDESIAAGMDDHLGKPLDMEKVFQVLRKYL